MKNLRVFAGLKSAELELITSAAQTKYFSEGEIVFEEGSLIREVAILLTGSVEISTMGFHRNEKPLYTVAPGALIGRVRAGNIKNYGTAQAVRASTALVWDPVEFQKLLARIPGFRRNILAALEQRIRGMEKLYERVKKQNWRYSSLAQRKLSSLIGTKKMKVDYEQFQEIGSLIAFVIGLACVAGALLARLSTVNLE